MHFTCHNSSPRELKIIFIAFNLTRQAIPGNARHTSLDSEKFLTILSLPGILPLTESMKSNQTEPINNIHQQSTDSSSRSHIP